MNDNILLPLCLNLYRASFMIFFKRYMLFLVHSRSSFTPTPFFHSLSYSQLSDSTRKALDYARAPSTIYALFNSEFILSVIFTLIFDQFLHQFYIKVIYMQQ